MAAHCIFFGWNQLAALYIVFSLVQINWQHYTLYFLWFKSTGSIIHCIFFGWNQLAALYIVFSLVQINGQHYTLYFLWFKSTGSIIHCMVEINWQHYTLYFLWFKSTGSIIYCISFGSNQLTALYIVFPLVEINWQHCTLYFLWFNVIIHCILLLHVTVFHFTPGQKNSLIHETELLESHLQEVEDQVFWG